MGDFLDILVLVAITAGVFFLAYAATRFLPSRFARTGHTSHLQIQERIMLGKDRQVAIVRVGKQFFLVGVAGQSVQIGAELDPAPFQAESPDKNQTASTGHSGPATWSFSEMLRRAGLSFPGVGKGHLEDRHP